MDAAKYLREQARMCAEYALCKGCPIGHGECRIMEAQEPEKIVAIVEEWGKENPAQTRKDVLLGTYPKAELSEGIPKLCPRIIAGGLCEDYVVTGLTNYERCEKCRKKYWMEEV